MAIEGERWQRLLDLQQKTSAQAIESAIKTNETVQVVAGISGLFIILVGAIGAYFLKKGQDRIDDLLRQSASLKESLATRARDVAALSIALDEVKGAAAEVVSLRTALTQCEAQVKDVSSDIEEAKSAIGRTATQVHDVSHRIEGASLQVDLAFGDAGRRLRAAQRASEILPLEGGLSVIPFLLDSLRRGRLEPTIEAEILFGLSKRAMAIADDTDAVALILLSSLNTDASVRLMALKALGGSLSRSSTVQARFEQCATADAAIEVRQYASESLRGGFIGDGRN